jgi:hypothetical protein
MTDATAQMFPIAFGIIDPDTKRAELLYESFCSEYAWEDLEPLKDGRTSHYWCVLACDEMISIYNEKIDQIDPYGIVAVE